MTPVEIEKALAEIVLARIEDINQKIKATDSTNPTEKKTLALIRGIYELCLNGGMLWKAPDRSKQIEFKANLFPRFAQSQGLSNVHKIFMSAEKDERLNLTAALYGEIWMCDQILPKYQAELTAAQNNGDVKAEFEAKIKLEAVREILFAWQSWRVANGVYANIKVVE